jgi:P-type Cu2+ transporter
LLELAYAVEANSEHPIAAGIVAEAKKRGLTLRPVSNYHNEPGQGLKAQVEGRTVEISSPASLREAEAAFDETAVTRLAREGKTVVFILLDGQIQGLIALSDVVRPEAKQAVASLRALGIDSYMISGDNRLTASQVADQIGIANFFAEVRPAEKAARINEIRASGKKVAMTGDGINDAPALAAADLGIAVGAGTDVARETADIILVRSNPSDVVHILGLARATYRKMAQNLVWATAYNIIALPLAAGVLYNQGIVISPALGAAFMSLSTMIVAINARLLKLPK